MSNPFSHGSWGQFIPGRGSLSAGNLHGRAMRHTAVGGSMDWGRESSCIGSAMDRSFWGNFRCSSWGKHQSLDNIVQKPYGLRWGLVYPWFTLLPWFTRRNGAPWFCRVESRDQIHPIELRMQGCSPLHWVYWWVKSLGVCFMWLHTDKTLEFPVPENGWPCIKRCMANKEIWDIAKWHEHILVKFLAAINPYHLSHRWLQQIPLTCQLYLLFLHVSLFGGHPVYRIPSCQVTHSIWNHINKGTRSHPENRWTFTGDQRVTVLPPCHLSFSCPEPLRPELQDFVQKGAPGI